MHSFRLIIIFWIIILFSGVFPFRNGRAQVLLNGTVSLSGTGKHLKGVHITISGIKGGTVSDTAGRFIFTLPKPGNYQVKFTFLGCSPLEKQISPLKNGNYTLNASLEETSLMMNEIEIVDSRAERKVMETPMRMELIGAQTILENPGIQVTNVLDYVSGVNLSSTMGIFGSNQVVSMRGLSGDDQGRTLILLDGIPLNKSDGGSVNWNRINRGNIGDIMIIKGPGPAKYGSNAMGGVIEMNTKTFDNPVGGVLTVSYGSYETFRANYALGGKFAPAKKTYGFYYNLNGFYNRSAGYNPEIPEYIEPADTFYTNTYVREALIGGRLGYAFKNGQKLEAGLEFYNDKRGRGIEIYETGGAYDQHKNYMLRMRYQGSVKGLSWDLSGYYNNEGFRRMNEFMSDGAYNLYLVKSSRTDMGLNGNLGFKIGKYQQFIAGAEFKKGGVYGQDIYYTSTDLITNAGDIELYSAFIQDELKFVKGKIQVDAGLRFNAAVFHNGLFKIEYPSYSVEYLKNFEDTLISRHTWTDLDPKISVQYRFTDVSRIYLSIAKGFRAPNLDDLCRSGKTSQGFKISNPSLGPENLYNIETGGDVSLFKHLHLSASAYFSIGYDFMYTVATGDSVNMGYKLAPVLQKRNIGEVHIYGGEIDADYNFINNMSITAGYSLSVSDIVKYGGPVIDSTSDLVGKSLVDVPIHKITAGYSWNNKILSFNLLYKFVSSRWINDQNIPDPVLGVSKFPAYQTISFRLWHTFFSKLTFALDVENLFDVRYIDSHYQQSPGRMIMAEVDFTF